MTPWDDQYTTAPETSSWKNAQSQQADDAGPAEPISAKTHQPDISTSNQDLATFTRRSAALSVDMLLLFIILTIFGWFFSSWLLDLGTNGRWIGLGLLLLYFGIEDSAVSGGQTLGKYIYHIAVRGTDGLPISPGRAVARSALLAIPFVFFGWRIPAFYDHPVNGWVQKIVIVLGAAGLYTLLFNRYSRQLIHDLICRTYVIKASVRKPGLPRTASGHLLATGCIALVCGFMLEVQSTPENLQPGTSTLLHLTLQQDPRFQGFDLTERHVAAMPKREDSREHSHTEVFVEAYYSSRLSPEERATTAKQIADAVLAVEPSVERLSRITVQITNAWDLVIARGSVSRRYPLRTQEWSSTVTDKLGHTVVCPLLIPPFSFCFGGMK